MEHLDIRICRYSNKWNSLMVLFTASADAAIDTHQVKPAKRLKKPSPEGGGSLCTG